MASNPFYHLRPNKSIDRSLFLQTLIGLSSLRDMTTYQYTGFGSYLFDDFRLMHDTFGLTQMTSLEIDPTEYKRAQYNCPYKCIEIKNISSTEYLANLTLDEDSHNIFWLDFVSPSELGSQLGDFATLLEQLNPYDLVRITLNANPAGLGKTERPDMTQAFRLEQLKNRIPNKYLPATLSEESVTTPKYPLTLLKILQFIAVQSLIDRPPFSPNFLFPLFATVYADGQQMLTFTGIVLDNHAEEANIKKALSSFPHNTFAWDNPCYIEIPTLSVKELIELNARMPDENIRDILSSDFDFIFPRGKEKARDSYISYYKYYPNFHKISL